MGLTTIPAGPISLHASPGEATPNKLLKIKAPGSARGEQAEDFDSLTRKQPTPAVPQADQIEEEDGEGQESDKAPEDEDNKDRNKIPACCKTKSCRLCRELCFRDPSKRQKSCTRIIC